MTRPLMWLGFARGARDAETTRQTGRQRCGAIDARVTRQSPCDLRNPQHGTRRAEMTECRKRRHRLRKSLHRGSHLEQHGSVVAGLRHVPAASISARTPGCSRKLTLCSAVMRSQATANNRSRSSGGQSRSSKRSINQINHKELDGWQWYHSLQLLDVARKEPYLPPPAQQRTAGLDAVSRSQGRRAL